MVGGGGGGMMDNGWWVMGGGGRAVVGWWNVGMVEGGAVSDGVVLETYSLRMSLSW